MWSRNLPRIYIYTNILVLLGDKSHFSTLHAERCDMLSRSPTAQLVTLPCSAGVLSLDVPTSDKVRGNDVSSVTQPNVPNSRAISLKNIREYYVELSLIHI